MKRLFFILAIVISTIGTCTAGIDSSNARLCDTLAVYLDNLDLIIEDRENVNEQLRRRRHDMNPGTERVAVTEELGKRYILNNVDSAAIYLRLALNEAIANADEEDVMRLDLQLYSLMPVLGISKEAVDAFEDIDIEEVPPTLRRNYWQAAAEIYHLVQRPYPQGAYKRKYIDKTLLAIDSLKSYYPVNSPIEQYLTAQANLLRGEINLAVAGFIEVLPRLKSHPELTDIAMKSIIDYYQDKPKYHRLYMSFLISRAIKDLRRGIIRPSSLAEVGRELIEDGEDRLGQRCLNLAMESPDLSYAGLYRPFDRTRYAHYITDSTTSTRRKALAWILIFSVVLMLVGAYAIRQHRISTRRSETIKALEDKISQVEFESSRTNQNLVMLVFLALEQLKDYNLHIIRKLNAGQVKDLHSDVESGKYIQRQTEKYFEVFDNTFLSSFPDFVTKLNELLQPDRRLSLLPGDRLSPELRIAAFLRLGVTDSSKLSQALALSLNTIYTYRNRLRGRAIDRDNLEKNLMKIS
ncbi:MAG: hypothetical protein K2I04_00125 [Muribaculaceae bacterium]|nr:hypothetical protein [Muribaculaceae bacterium]